MGTTLANPTVQINNVTHAVKPNSISYKKGKGDRNQRPQSSGGDAVEIIMTEDAETKKSMFKATFITTKIFVDALDTWMDNDDSNTVRLSEGDFNLPFRKMAVIGDPEINTGADGETEVEFCGQPVQ